MSLALTSNRVHRMTEAELDRVIEIERSLAQAPHWPRSAYLKALDPKAVPLRITLVVEEAGVVAGFTVASLIPPQAELESIAVSTQFQRIGLAGELFAALVADFRKAGIAETFLEVRASNKPAITFYRRLGFAETARRLRYYIDPVEDAVLMSLLI